MTKNPKNFYVLQERERKNIKKSLTIQSKYDLKTKY